VPLSDLTQTAACRQSLTRARAHARVASIIDPVPSVILAEQKPASFLHVDGGIVRLLRDALRAQPGLHRAALCGALPRESRSRSAAVCVNHSPDACCSRVCPVRPTHIRAQHAHFGMVLFWLHAEASLETTMPSVLRSPWILSWCVRVKSL